MLYKPDKDDYMFKEIFGGDVTANQQVMVVWRHETHGEARIWRLLGMIELPSHTRAHSFINRHMQKISKSYGIPLRYFNDGSHLDPSQVEAQSETSNSETRHD
ncbi:putative phospholipid-translocating ATPase [Pseudozyma hubeiensis]|nr:putative phospholipid-translocating ATPase [Pseudozyma hubeiensis]